SYSSGSRRPTTQWPRTLKPSEPWRACQNGLRPVILGIPPAFRDKWYIVGSGRGQPTATGRCQCPCIQRRAFGPDSNMALEIKGFFADDLISSTRGIALGCD